MYRYVLFSGAAVRDRPVCMRIQRGFIGWSLYCYFFRKALGCACRPHGRAFQFGVTFTCWLLGKGEIRLAILPLPIASWVSTLFCNGVCLSASSFVEQEDVVTRCYAMDWTIRGLHEVVKHAVAGKSYYRFMAKSRSGPTYRKPVQSMCLEKNPPVTDVLGSSPDDGWLVRGWL